MDGAAWSRPSIICAAPAPGKRLDDGPAKPYNDTMTGKRLGSGVLTIFTVACLAPSGLLAQRADPKKTRDEKKAAVPKFVAGKVVRIDDKRVGYQRHFLIYVPSDYTPHRKWPVIFSYHGQGGNPNVGTFRSLTEGRGFVIVAMPYIQKEMSIPSKRAIPRAEWERQYAVETRAMREIFLPYVEEHLRVDRTQLFIGGISRGGWATSVISENSPSLWAGVVILAAGRSRRSRRAPFPGGFRNKPIFIGVGERDVNNRPGRRAASFYAALGAKVTLEVFKGLGHAVDDKNPALRKWLRINGPLRNLPAKLAAARRDRKLGRFGRAYEAYRHLAALDEKDPSCRDAAREAAALARPAEKKLSAARSAVNAKQFDKAIRALVSVTISYRHSVFEKRAQEFLQKLRSDPKIKALTEQIRLNTRAQSLAGRAAAAEKAGKYAEAMKLYKQYVRRYAKADGYKQVLARFEVLKGNKAIQGALLEGKARADCPGWLAMADNYIKIRKPQKARPYLEKILKKYPRTRWAEEAQRRLKKIRSSR